MNTRKRKKQALYIEDNEATYLDAAHVYAALQRLKELEKVYG